MLLSVAGEQQYIMVLVVAMHSAVFEYSSVAAMFLFMSCCIQLRVLIVPTTGTVGKGRKEAS